MKIDKYNFEKVIVNFLKYSQILIFYLEFSETEIMKLINEAN